MLLACQYQTILFERSLASKLSNTPKMTFISHLKPLQISNKAKFYAFFEKFSHLKLKPAPTQDKFLDFLQNEFTHSKCFQKNFFSLEWGCVPTRARASTKFRIFSRMYNSKVKKYTRKNVLSFIW